MRPYIVLVLCLLASCARLGRAPKVGNKEISLTKFGLKDSAGKFQVVREVGQNKEHDAVVKMKILPEDGDEKHIVEKSIVISAPSSAMAKKTKISYLRPKMSQYTVWFEGKKHTSEIRLNQNENFFELTLKNPELAQKKVTRIPIDNPNSVYCFYSQLIECVRSTQFIDLAREKGAGEMNFYIVWNGHPYFQEQYPGLSTEMVGPAKFIYNGKNSKGDLQFSLRVNDQSIMYHLDKDLNLSKIFWISQGLVMTKGQI